MKIDTLKDLKDLVKACRKMGIDKIKVDNLEIDLGSLPTSGKHSSTLGKSVSEDHVFKPGGLDDNTPIDMPDELTEEQLLMWSSSGGQELGPGETV